MEEEKEESDLKPKKSNKKAIIIGAVLVILIAVIVVLLFAFGVFGGSKKDDDKKEEKPTDKKEEVTEVEVNIDTTPLKNVKPSDFDGVYKNKKSTIKIYALDEKHIFVISLSSEIDFTATVEFNNDKLGDMSFDNFTIELYKEGIGVESEDDSLESLAYKRVEDYTKEEVFKDLYGDKENLDGKYNYLYELESGSLLDEYPKGKILLYAFETNDGNIALTEIAYEYYNSEQDFLVLGSGTNFLEKQADGTYIPWSKANVFSFKDDKLIVTNNEEENQVLPLDGTYKKVKELTMDDVLQNMGPIYSPD